MSITPDLVEWLLADQKVCQCWKKLGMRMNLSCYIGYIESQEKSNSASLRMLLRLWSSAKPECYNVKSLKRVLAAEGLHHMWLWISLMTQRQPQSVIAKKVLESNNSRLRENLTENMTRSRSYTTSHSTRPTTTSPWSKYLYNNNPTSESSGYTSDYFSSGDYQASEPEPTRPSSRQDYSYFSGSGYTSCPTTPVNNRKKFDFSFSSEPQNSSPSMQYSPTSNFQRSSSSSRINSDTDMFSQRLSRNNFTTPKSHVRSSSLSRLPKLAKLTSPKIVETEIWKKEIYKKVTEETRDFYTPKQKPKLTKSGSLPNLPNYITSIDIQVVPSRSIRFPPSKQNQKKQSEHEKEILKLCGDIITELKPPTLNIEIDTEDEHQTYAKINRVSIKHSPSPSKQPVVTKSQNQTNQKKNETVADKTDKFVSVKNVQIEVEEEPKIKPVEVEIKHTTKKTVHELPEVVKDFTNGKSHDDLPDVRSSGRYFTSMVEDEKRSNKFEIDDCMSSSVDNDSDSSTIISSDTIETVKSYNSGQRNSSVNEFSKKGGFGGGHFENLVNILTEAVKDISR